jgi:hypothetical protein
MQPRDPATAQILQVHPHCLMFFVDETGHEEFAEPKYPVFGLGGFPRRDRPYRG